MNHVRLVEFAQVKTICVQISFARLTRRNFRRRRHFVNSALEILRRERDDASEQIRSLKVRIRDLESAINILEGQPAPAFKGRGGGDLKQMVLLKLGEFGPDGGTPKELAERLTQQGRPTSDASISSTLSRLKAESKVANQGGRWFPIVVPLSDAGSDSPMAPNPTKWDDDLDDDTPF